MKILRCAANFIKKWKEKYPLLENPVFYIQPLFNYSKNGKRIDSDTKVEIGQKRRYHLEAV